MQKMVSISQKFSYLNIFFCYLHNSNAIYRILTVLGQPYPMLHTLWQCREPFSEPEGSVIWVSGRKSFCLAKFLI